MVIVLSVIGFLWLVVNGCKTKSAAEFAKQIVKDDYPALICTADSGNFRVYEDGEYEIGKFEDLGYNVWWSDKARTPSTSFHVQRCEYKDPEFY